MKNYVIEYEIGWIKDFIDLTLQLFFEPFDYSPSPVNLNVFHSFCIFFNRMFSLFRLISVVMLGMVLSCMINPHCVQYVSCLTLSRRIMLFLHSGHTVLMQVQLVCCDILPYFHIIVRTIRITVQESLFFISDYLLFSFGSWVFVWSYCSCSDQCLVSLFSYSIVVVAIIYSSFFYSCVGSAFVAAVDLAVVCFGELLTAILTFNLRIFDLYFHMYHC